MITFWDSSAVVPLLVEETRTPHSLELLGQTKKIVVWCFTSVECLSALYRRERTKQLSEVVLKGCFKNLKKLDRLWMEVTHTTQVKKKAERLLGAHVLQASDSLQLAAALVACDDHPSRLNFVTFDEQLARAAIKEGFNVLS